MKEYCIWGTTKPFKTKNDFFKAVRNQAFGKTEDNFCDIEYPHSYFSFAWSGGYLVINFYNTQTGRTECYHTRKKTLSYSYFTELLDGTIGYMLPSLYKYPTGPDKNGFWEIVWSIFKWVFQALFWLLGAILKGLWTLIKGIFSVIFG
jgi:hypothetical protein